MGGICYTKPNAEPDTLKEQLNKINGCHLLGEGFVDLWCLLECFWVIKTEKEKKKGCKLLLGSLDVALFVVLSV